MQKKMWKEGLMFVQAFAKWWVSLSRTLPSIDYARNNAGHALFCLSHQNQK